MLNNLLNTCGLNETEQKVFLHLLERGGSIASIVARQVQLKRPTVYAALESLVKIGLIAKQKQDRVNYFVPVNPQVIPRIFEEKAEREYEEMKMASKLLRKQLQSMAAKKTILNPHIFENVTYHSIDSVYVQLEDALLGGDFCSIFNPQISLVGRFKSIVQDFLRETGKTKPHIKEIMVAGPEAQWYKSMIQNENHICKEIPANMHVMSDFILSNKQVFLLDYNQHNEVAIRITHERHFQTFMAIFEMLWNNGQA